MDEKKKAVEIVSKLVVTLTPYAEPPTDRMDEYSCHNGIATKEECGRCSRAIAAWNTIQEAKKWLNTNS